MPRFQLGWGERWGGTCGIIYPNPLILGSVGAVAQLVEHFAGSIILSVFIGHYCKQLNLNS